MPIARDGFTYAHPRYQTSYYEGLVAKMLACGNPEQIGYIAYRCLRCGQDTHRVAMSCTSSLCLRCAKVSLDNWVSQVSKVLHEGVIYRSNELVPDNGVDIEKFARRALCAGYVFM